MADQFDSKLDVAEKILNFIANNRLAGKIREDLKQQLDLTEEDMEDAAEIVTDFSRLIKNQKY
jgi:hypothetical protein